MEIPEVNEWAEDRQEEENKYSDMVKKVVSSLKKEQWIKTYFNYQNLEF